MPDITTSVCSVEGCDTTYNTPAVLRPRKPGHMTMGICPVHYRRFKSSGDVHKVQCHCKCGELVDLTGNNLIFKAFAPGHQEAAAQARKLARAQAVLELCEWAAEPPDITKREAADLNYLLAQTQRRRCSNCKLIKPLTDFPARRSPDPRKASAKPQDHLRVDWGPGVYGYTTVCTPCCTIRTLQWLKDNPNRFTKECAWCGKEFTAARRSAKCCSSQCSGRFGGDAKAKLTDTRQRPCARPDCNVIFSRTSPDIYKIKWCSEECYIIFKQRSMRRDGSYGKSEFRVAVEAMDYDAMIAELRLRTTAIEPSGCWNWNGKGRTSGSGGGGKYPYVRFGKKDMQVHRIVLEVKHGKSLGSQHAHHTCGNTQCVNPDHLQPVTHRENMAEMLTRKSLTNRIEDLEAWIREREPDAAILNVIDLR